MSSGPLTVLISSVASCSFHFSLLSSPKYPEKAFCPQGQLMGFAMGANAEHDLYFSGLRKNCNVISLVTNESRFLCKYNCQCTVAAHAVSSNAHTPRVQLLE